MGLVPGRNAKGGEWDESLSWDGGVDYRGRNGHDSCFPGGLMAACSRVALEPSPKFGKGEEIYEIMVLSLGYSAPRRGSDSHVSGRIVAGRRHVLCIHSSFVLRFLNGTRWPVRA